MPGQSPPTELADWLALLERRHPRTIDLGLERCGRVWRRLGAPRPGKRIITVAGTNGKGSTVAWLDSLFTALGQSTAAYTSPHLLTFNERLRIQGEPIGDDALLDAFARVEAARGNDSLTYYEFSTLACLVLMAEHGPDVALLEVGLGGRLDTVNLVDADLAVIMPIGLDHQQYLGTNRETIGFEKAGILRAGRPLVCGEPEPPDSVLAHAGSLGCPIFLPGRDYEMVEVQDGLEFRTSGLSVRLPHPPLAGRFQAGNLGAAMMAVAQFCPDWAARQSVLRRAVSGVRLKGRLQRLERDPRVMVDVGHNPHAAQALATYLATGKRVHCVLGMFADKDVETTVSALEPCVAAWYCAGLPGQRGQEGATLMARVSAVSERPAEAHETVCSALDAARRSAPDDGAILVFGSFETAATALRECC